MDREMDNGDVDTSELKSFNPVLREIAQERLNQNGKWGGVDHDDKHGYYDFATYIKDKLFKGCCATADDNAPEARKRMVQVAALAVANIERMDRKLK